ncbi:hypothetical protein EXE51_15500 [Halorubrum sp. CGM5_25_10-8B]|uniref:DUF7344 domain-containing protein n=1 Tax=Halorubrum ezzemoulense TaxID=337243 RepID=UPI0010F7EFD6|nr:hypothetical protein [Halorubrum ezzemoulense]TKX35225.1 hypothetical protein EXE51_15500 [Halorubrum sp. CGM5_25_10-8B]TKX62664.1 hypothetical protein EXE47_15095 [Halorubrum sp. GN12_10-3_MGM]
MSALSQPTQTSTQLSHTDIHDLLSNSRRRHTIHILKRDDGEGALSSIAEEVAAWENDKPVAAVESSERHRVYTSIQQNHIPRLERAGIITHDRGDLELTSEADRLDLYMDVVPDDSIPWGEYYLGLSAFSLGLVAAAWVGVFPASIPTLMWAALIGLLFAGSSAYHVYESSQQLLGNSEKPPEFNA